MTTTVTGSIVDLHERRVFGGAVTIEDGVIQDISESDVSDAGYLLPGFVDAHVHIESSMLVPSEFARLASVHGTVATVSDPHEIANVLGVPGVQFMIENAARVPFKFNFGAPSCVPATSFETAGANIGPEDVESLLDSPAVRYLSEMMNYPGVLAGDPAVLRKIRAAQTRRKPVDGHAPQVRGEDARRYVDAGISTDHECASYEEAAEKLSYGMKILIREGSAARNFDALIGLLDEHPDRVMFCSDDKHPDELVEGHIDILVRRALARRTDLFSVLRAACVNPVEHYGLQVGLLRIGDPTDFIRVDDVERFRVLETFVDGQIVARNGRTLIEPVSFEPTNVFSATPTRAGDYLVPARGARVRVIEAIDGEIVTGEVIAAASRQDGFLVADLRRDILKIAVVNRYQDAAPAVAFVTGFGLKEGAIASSVAHDSHNIVAVGADDQVLSQAVNLVIANRGGVAAVGPGREEIVALPVAGLMSDRDGHTVAQAYRAVDRLAKDLGSELRAPLMTLSFMALLVIPALKLSDKGLFDGRSFEFVDVSI